jgi:hypothetical protein
MVMMPAANVKAMINRHIMSMRTCKDPKLKSQDIAFPRRVLFGSCTTAKFARELMRKKTMNADQILRAC